MAAHPSSGMKTGQSSSHVPTGMKQGSSSAHRTSHRLVDHESLKLSGPAVKGDRSPKGGG